MFEGLHFGAPAMLLGLLAASIPFLLHLMSSIRAQEVLYPTLRFLRISMEKTSRRRHLQHWLLLAVRALMLGLLALVVAEPFFKVGKDWAGASQAASVIVIDNSYSMAARDEAGVRLERARAGARELLDDPKQRPAQAALFLTNSDNPVSRLTGDMEALRNGVDNTGVGYGKNLLVSRLHEAVTRLSDEGSTPEKSIYVFTDLHREGFNDLLRTSESDSVFQRAQDNGIHILMINVGQPNLVNVGISDLQISGRRIADQPILFNVTLENSTNDRVRVHVDLRIDGQQNAAERQTLTIEPFSREARQFRHSFPEEGMYSGDVSVSFAADATGFTLVDQLEVDNRRQFAIEIDRRVRTLIFRGYGGEDGSGLDGTAYLKPALDGLKNLGRPWSISPEIHDSANISPEALAGASMVIFDEVERFNPEQAQSVIDFVSAGGTALFFLGPTSDIDNYNTVFYDDLKVTGPLLPGRIGAAQGSVGPNAQAESVDMMDLANPFLTGLYPNAENYKVMMVNRFYRIEDVAPPASAVMSLRSGPPLVASKPFGKGLSVMFPTTASPRWSNFCSGGSPVFFSMLYRMALESPRQMQAEQMFLAGANIPVETGPLKPDSERPASVLITVTPPELKPGDAPLKFTPSLNDATGYAFMLEPKQVLTPGIYSWAIEGASEGLVPRRVAGLFAVNPDGSESNLASLTTREMQTLCENRNFTTVFVDDTLEAVQTRAAEASQGSPFWDKLLPLVILLLIAEALIANRRKLNEGTTKPMQMSVMAPTTT